jgi:hypothetical protein
LVGPAWSAQQDKCLVKGVHDIVDLGDSLVLPFLDLGLLGWNAGLLYGVAVVELDELLLLAGQFVQPAFMPLSLG